MKTIGIIGTGMVGTPLGLLFLKSGYAIGPLYNRTIASSEKARAILDAGTVAASFKEFGEVDILLITTNDSSLASVAQQVADAVFLKAGTIALHCSGALPSSILSPLQQKGAKIASIHPVKSFTDPLSDAESFPGTWCGAEGDEVALEILEPLFRSMGAQMFRIEADKKTLYHTGTVVASNYLAPLLEAALQLHEEAGIQRETSLRLLEPIVQATLANIAKMGTSKALTGPIARGDADVVRRQLAALESFKPEYAALYGTMGSLALPLAKDKGVADKEGLAALQTLLDRFKTIRSG